MIADAAAWRAWLDANEAASDGVWLVLAKKGTQTPTSLRYDQALDEALCSGWIDGQRRSRDDSTFLQRFTPRRKSSLWSQRNITLVAALTEQSRMRPAGLAEVSRAQADGRWDRAYAGQATAEAPEDLRRALDASPQALGAFDALTRAEMFALIHPVVTAANAPLRARRVAAAIERLEQISTAQPH